MKLEVEHEITFWDPDDDHDPLADQDGAVTVHFPSGDIVRGMDEARAGVR